MQASMLRLYVSAPLVPGQELALPEAAARHVQVRRLQPGNALVLFDGGGMDWPGEVLSMGRREVTVRVGQPVPGLPELPMAITLACGMPANERMDALVEKAAELGASALQPLICERSVLRLAGERAERRREHWQAVAASASEQSGRALVMQVGPVLSLQAWLAVQIDATPARAQHSPPEQASALASARRFILSTGAGHQSLPALLAFRGPHSGPAGPERPKALSLLSGPEGGFSPAEDAAAVACGFQRASLGPRVLRADTAPLAALAWLASPIL
jgi:16S rRNA (uracil1498-N3)-methyltransferase